MGLMVKAAAVAFGAVLGVAAAGYLLLLLLDAMS